MGDAIPTYKNKPIPDYSLDELEAIDWELASQEYNFNEALKHPKFEKLKPLPQLSPSFVTLRENIKQEIERKKNEISTSIETGP